MLLRLALPALFAAATATAQLPGELTADAVLGGAQPYPPTPARFRPPSRPADSTYLASHRLVAPPPPGEHPRLLITRAELPELRERLEETSVGQALLATLRRRTAEALRKPGAREAALYTALSSGDAAAARAELASSGLPKNIGHYQPWFYAIVLESLDALIFERKEAGVAAATAIATYSEIFTPEVIAAFEQPMADDVWRASPAHGAAGAAGAALSPRDVVGGHLLGYAYDFAHGFMTEAQRSSTRGLIATVTHGRLWMGARLPAHFRNWNWVALALQQPLLALAIEGEEGYDPRVYSLGVQIARDYLDHGISPSGISTESVGYTQFGFVWFKPFLAAAARRGDNLLTHPHLRATLDWYVHTTLPSRLGWSSHGDNADGAPSLWSLSLWRHFFPSDPRVGTVWRSLTLASGGSRLLNGNFHLVEPLLWAEHDPFLANPNEGPESPEALALPLTLRDPVRGSLKTRSSWKADATLVHFECRVDSVGASHEHADRGHFTLAALGRTWGKDNFRSVETRHHNSVLIDGLGQGYWAPPGRWLHEATDGTHLIATVDVADAYGWFWPKQILAEPVDLFPRFGFRRWSNYREEAKAFQTAHADMLSERDPGPGVADFWRGFVDVAGGPRLWDEDAWPVRLPHNPVQRARRTLVFAAAPNPYLVVYDDIQKDDRERLYEWLLQTGLDTDITVLDRGEVILCDASVARNRAGVAQPTTGDRQLLVRVVHSADPAEERRFTARPSFRLETFERRDTLRPESKPGALSGSRSFGLDKRLVIASRSVAPRFTILLYPHRKGETLPETDFEEATGTLNLRFPDFTDSLFFPQTEAGGVVRSARQLHPQP